MSTSDYTYAARPRTRFEQWQLDRTRCFPDLCMYAYACPELSRRACSVAGDRPRYVARADCFRHRPPERRPPAGLSKLVLRLLDRLRASRGG